MREDIAITVYEQEAFSGFDIPEKATDFIEFWQSKLAMVPAEFIDSARIEFEAEEYCESATVNVELYYVRPESDEEAAARVANNETCEERIRVIKLRRYEALKQELKL